MRVSESQEPVLRERFFLTTSVWLASLCVAAGVSGAVAVAAEAQPQTPVPTPQSASAPIEARPQSQAALTKGEIKAMREFKMLDFNGDGKLSRTEVKLFPRLANAFDDADTDHDGYVSYEEVRVFAAKYRAERDRQKAAQAAAAPASATP
jgi:16S rRNA A1518/A1519 N6-dimethyltransferase RsmA/KsgA/DIM1 with predicted DNA glycosylase/AP lyase activity